MEIGLSRWRLRGFFFVLVVVRGGEKRTGSLVPGKPEEVYSDAVIPVVCSLRALATRWRVRALDYSWEASGRCCWIWIRGVYFGRVGVGVDKEISIFNSDHCFEGFTFGVREIIVMDQK